MAIRYKKRRGYQPRNTEAEHLINQAIRVPKVRIVGDEEEIETGIFDTRKALQIADSHNLDLVMISPKADPPVCKVIDYKKFLYQEKKRQKEQKAKQTKIVIKEVRFGPNTDDHDLEFKMRHAQKFLEEGAKVKAFVFFKGRSIIFKERGFEMLKKFAEGLSEYGTVDQEPKLEGKRLSVFMTPIKKK